MNRGNMRIAAVALIEMLLGFLVWMLWQPWSFPAPPGANSIALAVKIFFSIAFGCCMAFFLSACSSAGFFREIRANLPGDNKKVAGN